MTSLKEGEEISLGGLKLSIKNDCLYCDREKVSIVADKVVISIIHHV